MFLVIDVGCDECGVGHEVVSVHKTRSAAEMAATRRYAENGGWRDGGQTIATVFEIPDT